jgi:hypothetical protein
LRYPPGALEGPTSLIPSRRFPAVRVKSVTDTQSKSPYAPTHPGEKWMARLQVEVRPGAGVGGYSLSWTECR